MPLFLSGGNIKDQNQSDAESTESGSYDDIPRILPQQTSRKQSTAKKAPTNTDGSFTDIAVKQAPRSSISQRKVNNFDAMSSCKDNLANNSKISQRGLNKEKLKEPVEIDTPLQTMEKNNDVKWFLMYNKVKLLMEGKSSTDYDFSLRDWINNQRMAFKLYFSKDPKERDKSRLSEDRVKLLKELGFEWGAKGPVVRKYGGHGTMPNTAHFPNNFVKQTSNNLITSKLKVGQLPMTTGDFSFPPYNPIWYNSSHVINKQAQALLSEKSALQSQVPVHPYCYQYNYPITHQMPNNGLTRGVKSMNTTHQPNKMKEYENNRVHNKVFPSPSPLQNKSEKKMKAKTRGNKRAKPLPEKNEQQKRVRSSNHIESKKSATTVVTSITNGDSTHNEKQQALISLKREYEKAWRSTLEQLKQFIEMNSLKCFEDLFLDKFWLPNSAINRLRNWIREQQKQYHKFKRKKTSALTKEKVKELENAGMTWDRNPNEHIFTPLPCDSVGLCISRQNKLPDVKTSENLIGQNSEHVRNLAKDTKCLNLNKPIDINVNKESKRGMRINQSLALTSRGENGNNTNVKQYNPSRKNNSIGSRGTIISPSKKNDKNSYKGKERKTDGLSLSQKQASIKEDGTRYDNRLLDGLSLSQRQIISSLMQSQELLQQVFEVEKCGEHMEL